MKGSLFLVVGNSASGKDAVMKYASEKIENLKVVKRYITRPNGKGEDYYSIDFKDFNPKDYFLSWESYDKFYGISCEVLNHLEMGKNYLVNVSRQVLKEAKNKWKNTFVVELIVPLELTKERLNNRGREDENEIKKRLHRAMNPPVVDSDVQINTSNSDVSVAGEQLVSFIRRII